MLISTFLEEVALLWVNAVSQRVIKSNSYEGLMSHSCDLQMLSLTRPSKQTSLSAPGGLFEPSLGVLMEWMFLRAEAAPLGPYYANDEA